MLGLTEAKAQGWRAMVRFKDGRPDALLFIGRSTTAVRAGYIESYFETLDEEERGLVEKIELQHWNGAADSGTWKRHGDLRIPMPQKLAKSA